MPHATFQLLETEDGMFRWRLQTDDDTVIASSEHTHETKQAAMREVQRLKHVAEAAGVESGDC